MSDTSLNSGPGEIAPGKDAGSKLVQIATLATCAYIVIVVGRGTELVPALRGIPVGDVCVGIAFMALLFSPSGSFAKAKGSFLFGGVMLFAFLCLVSISWSIWFPNSVKFFLTAFMLTMILYVLVLKISRSPKHVEEVFTALALCSLSLVLAGLLARTGGGRLWIQSSYDPNDLAMILVSLLPIVLLKYQLASSLIPRVSYLLLVLGSIFVVILTQSRGGMVALAVVMLYLIFFGGFKSEYSSPWAARVFVRSFAVVLLATIILLMAPDEALERLGSLFEISQDYNVTGEKDGRLAIWGRGFEYLSSAPWGTGIAAFNVAESLMGGQFRAPHNSFVQAIVEIGIIGGIVYLSLYVRAARQLHRISKSPGEQNPPAESFRTIAYSRALLGAILGYAAAAFFLSHAYSPLAFVLFALTAAVVRIRDSQADRQAPGQAIDRIP